MNGASIVKVCANWPKNKKGLYYVILNRQKGTVGVCTSLEAAEAVKRLMGH